MVLAAHRMSDPTANLEYFRHLAELFQIGPARGQNPEWREQLGLPKDGDDYPDEELWREWNWWLAARLRHHRNDGARRMAVHPLPGLAGHPA